MISALGSSRTDLATHRSSEAWRTPHLSIGRATGRVSSISKTRSLIARAERGCRRRTRRRWPRSWNRRRWSRVRTARRTDLPRRRRRGARRCSSHRAAAPATRARLSPMVCATTWGRRCGRKSALAVASIRRRCWASSTRRRISTMDRLRRWRICSLGRQRRTASRRTWRPTNWRRSSRFWSRSPSAIGRARGTVSRAADFMEFGQ